MARRACTRALNISACVIGNVRSLQSNTAYNSSHAQRAAETQQTLLEKENNAQLGELQSQASPALFSCARVILSNFAIHAQIESLKALSIDIGDEVVEQNKLLDNMVRAAPRLSSL